MIDPLAEPPQPQPEADGFDDEMPGLDAVNNLSPEPDDDDEPETKVDVSQLANAIVGAVNQAAGPRMIKNGEYMRERSEHRDKPQLTRKVYQNGILLDRRQLTAEDIRLLAHIRPGVYFDGDIRIVELREGDAKTNVTSLDIRYENKTVDQRMAFKARFGSFTGTLRAIVHAAGGSLVSA
ncbi:MAG: hypothetical protein QM736_20575 [Vicinamibacterales bacterium]